MPQFIPDLRLSPLTAAPASPHGDFVLYWMTSARRTTWNFALQHAVARAIEFAKPLLIVETLPCAGCWDSHRTHGFVIDGMRSNARQLARSAATYYPFVERAPGEIVQLIKALARKACVVVCDEFPIREHVAQLTAASEDAPVRFEQVDSNGLLPLRAADHAFPTAYAFRRFLQKTLMRHIAEMPLADPLQGAHLRHFEGIPPEISQRWPPASPRIFSANYSALRALPIDHRVDRVPKRGGSEAAERALSRFLDGRLARYVSERNDPDIDATSGLSPWLHHGQISSHQIFAAIVEREGWTASKVALKPTGGRAGWWGVSESAEAFLDQLITWREIGFNMAHFHPDDYDRYESLPAWAQETLQRHANDPRSYLYTLDQFATAATHDPLWNAAQRQLLREGMIHNYLRMLWGKKILEWTASPREALDVMIELNNRYAIDGCNPNSYSGILWVLGRYDRPWGPERLVFGNIRFMSSANTARKVRVKEFLRKFGR